MNATSNIGSNQNNLIVNDYSYLYSLLHFFNKKFPLDFFFKNISNTNPLLKLLASVSDWIVVDHVNNIIGKMKKKKLIVTFL